MLKKKKLVPFSALFHQGKCFLEKAKRDSMIVTTQKYDSEPTVRNDGEIQQYDITTIRW